MHCLQHGLVVWVQGCTKACCLHGVLFDVDTCGICDPTEKLYFDGMHTAVGSGSGAQWEINAFVQEMDRHGIPAQDIDKFIPVVKWPYAKRVCLA